jgi:predicted protein tyrosine phosphatase
MKFINTVKTEKIHCIVSKIEIQHIDSTGCVLISITDPDSDYIGITIREKYDDVLNIQFFDVTENTFVQINSTSKLLREPLTFEQGRVIKEFILKNKDKKFAIHCSAGISRSAAVGCAINCLLDCNGDIYEYQTGYSCAVKKHNRYHPNKTVFDRIIGVGNVS